MTIEDLRTIIRDLPGSMTVVVNTTDPEDEVGVVAVTRDKSGMSLHLCLPDTDVTVPSEVLVWSNAE